jgi:alkylation response protein AidB-like acyl-CoA dehydrogenase
MINLENNWFEHIRRLSPIAEQEGKLTDEMLAIAYEQQWFKLFVPTAYGGPGKKLSEILKLEEELAYADGSLGWTVTLCAGAAWFAGFLEPQLAKEIFADPKVCFAGSGAVSGTAQESENGFVINGNWKYASGALHATIFTLNCILQDRNGNDILDENGQQKIKSFILKKDEVKILPGWSYFGLIATGSHAFEVNNIEIPSNRSFEINTEIKIADDGFDYPFLQLAETTLTVNSLGMTKHFIELVEDYFYNRSGLKRFTVEQTAFFNTQLATFKKDLEDKRSEFYFCFNESWQQLITNGKIEEITLNRVSKVSRELAHLCRNIVDMLYPYCGLEAAKKDTEINRVWRDLHTASQHALLTFK